MNYWVPHLSSDDKETTHVVVFSTSISRRIRHFHVMVVKERQRDLEMYKSVLQNCFLLNKPIPFFAISLPSPLVECSLILSLAS